MLPIDSASLVIASDSCFIFSTTFPALSEKALFLSLTTFVIAVEKLVAN